MIFWHSFTKESRRLNPHTGAIESRFTSYLAATPNAYHVLTGQMGITTAEQVAAAWNCAGYSTSTQTTRAAADYGPRARRRYHIKNA